MFLTEEAAAKFLGMAKEGLRGMRKKNEGPPWHKFGRLVRYSLADLGAWAEAHRKGDSDE